MDSEQDEVTLWLNELGAGSEQAATRLWERYFPDLVRLARRRMEQLPRRARDEEDVALSALKSFYRGVQKGRFEDLSDRRELWNLLFVITLRKVYKEYRKGSTVRGESVLLHSGSDGSELGGIEQVLGDEPTSEMAFLFAETCQEMLDALPDDKLREVAILRMEGYSNPEIAERMNCTLRTIERKLNRIRSKWTPND